MNKNTRFIGIFVFLLVLTIVPFISATTTIVTPISNGNYTTTITVNVTTDVNASTVSYNVSLYCNKSGGSVDARAGADITKLVTISNSSAAQGRFVNAAVSITSLTDAITYNCSAYADNDTDQEFSPSVKGITFDSTSPVCTITKTSSNIPSNGWNSVTYSITDALSLKTNSSKISGPTGFTALNYTESSATKTINAQSLIGTWTFLVDGADRAGNTCTDTETYTSYNNNGGSITVSDQEFNQAVGANTPNYKIIAVILIIAVIWFVARKK